MKNLMNFAIVLFAVTLLAGTAYGQDGSQYQYGKNGDAPKVNWVDLDGDGICDNVGTVDGQAVQTKAQNKKMYKGQNAGSGDGTGLGNGYGDGSGIRPQDGTGFGKMNGAGIAADGTITLQKSSGRRARN